MQDEDHNTSTLRTRATDVSKLVCLSSALAGPLHDAAWRGNLTIVTGLIALGADVNAKKEDGKTRLHLSLLARFAAAVITLRKNGGCHEAH